MVANLFDPNKEQLTEWAKWLSSRPQSVRRVAEMLPPWKLYLLRSSRHKVSVLSYEETEDGGVTCRVHVGMKYNPCIFFEREVFGICPDDLEEGSIDEQ